MKRSVIVLLAVLVAMPVFAATLGTAANGVIPAEVQQIISVDYRRVNDSQTAMALKNRVLPQNLKEFETALKGIGINPANQMDNLTFVSYRVPTPPPKVQATSAKAPAAAKEPADGKPKTTLKIMGI